MAFAAVSRPPAPPAPPPPPPPPPPSAAMQWLSPRVSFSLDDAGGGGGGGREAGKASADFEFLLAGCSAVSSMLPADELFSGGKLVPLRIPAPASGSTTEGVATRPPLAPTATQQQPEPETPRVEAQATKALVVVEQAEQEPKIPARRWRDLLRLRKQQASLSTETRPLRRLLRRGPKPPKQEPSLSLPLLREPGPDEPDKPAPAAAPTPTPTPPLSQNLPPKIRVSPAQQAQPPLPPPPPSAVAADSPRLNAAGKVVFNGLGRSSSSPSSLAGGRRHRSSGSVSGSSGIERSYSAHVRVAPVLNVPVCRKSVSVFGIDRLFSPSSASVAAAHAAATKKVKAARKEVTPPPSL